MNSESTTLVCFALGIEARPFQRVARSDERVQVLLTGMGRASAETALRERLATGLPARVLSCGFAGGLNPELRLGDVVFEVEPASRLGPALTAVGARAARFYCADKVLATAVDKLALRNSSGADAVDMESAGMAEVCRAVGSEFGIVRVVSDECNEDLPVDFNRFMEADDRIDFVRLGRSVAFRPAVAVALMKWRRRLLRAAENLATVLGAVTCG